MSTTVIVLLAVIFIGILVALFYSPRKSGQQAATPAAPASVQPSAHSLPLRLQAYERLVLLADRIALPHLISRIGVQDISAAEMQHLLIQTIKQEFDHNVSQQIYVSNQAWEAIRNLKEQNLLIINQVASFLPAQATGAQLNKTLLELLMENPQASLHNVVSEAISYEAKQLM